MRWGAGGSLCGLQLMYSAAGGPRLVRWLMLTLAREIQIPGGRRADRRRQDEPGGEAGAEVRRATGDGERREPFPGGFLPRPSGRGVPRSEEHTSELQSPCNLVCRLLLEKKKKHK